MCSGSIGNGSAHPPQVPGEHVTQGSAAAGIAVVEIGGRHASACLPGRPHPVAPRKARQVGHPRAEVCDQPGRGHRAGPCCGRRRVRAGRDAGGRADLAGQVALGQQLAVALLHQAAGYTQLTSQLPRRRQPFAFVQAAAPDCLPQPCLKLGAQWVTAAMVEPQQQFRAQTGPLNRHDIGTYQQPVRTLASQA